MSYNNYIVSPHRLEWVKGHRKIRGCVFCRMFRGGYKPSRILHNDGKMAVIMNVFPYTTGHLLVVPVRHITELEKLPEADYRSLFSLVKKSVKLLRKAISPGGFNIGINMGGELTGASIEHLHVHVIPRFNDIGFLESTASTKVMPESLDDTYKRLMKFGKILGE